MIVCHRHRLIFIKTEKTAGTSIEVFLSQACGADAIVTPIAPPVAPHAARNHRGYFNPLPELLASRGRCWETTLNEWREQRRFYNHMPAFKARARLPRAVWDSYLKVCVERNPWDKTLSHYHMRRFQAGGKLDFATYLERGDYCLNYPLYTDFDGRLLVDQVMRYEQLDAELAALCVRVGIAFDGQLGVRAKADTRSDRRPYQTVYTPEQAALIGTIFRREIDLHGYTFD